VRARQPGRARARPPPAARPGQRRGRVGGAGAGRRRAGHGEAAGGPYDPPAPPQAARPAPPPPPPRAAAGGPRTGAVRPPRRGRVEGALCGPPEGEGEGGAPVPPRLALPEGSTVLISDVLDLPRDLQGRLASALDGPVRLVAATAGDPDAALRSERLRPDLYY